MTAAVNDFLRLFDALSEAEKHEAIAELLRRQPEGDIPDEALVSAADELFRQLDTEEHPICISS